MLNVGDKVILKRESEYTRKAGMLKGEIYVVNYVEEGCVKVEGFMYYHDMKRFELKKEETIEAEDF